VTQPERPDRVEHFEAVFDGPVLPGKHEDEVYCRVSPALFSVPRRGVQDDLFGVVAHTKWLCKLKADWAGPWCATPLGAAQVHVLLMNSRAEMGQIDQWLRRLVVAVAMCQVPRSLAWTLEAAAGPYRGVTLHTIGEALPPLEAMKAMAPAFTRRAGIKVEIEMYEHS
jgi:hypothetical protein